MGRKDEEDELMERLAKEMLKSGDVKSAFMTLPRIALQTAKKTIKKDKRLNM